MMSDCSIPCFLFSKEKYYNTNIEVVLIQPSNVNYIFPLNFIFFIIKHCGKWGILLIQSNLCYHCCGLDPQGGKTFYVRKPSGWLAGGQWFYPVDWLCNSYRFLGSFLHLNLAGCCTMTAILSKRRKAQHKQTNLC